MFRIKSRKNIWGIGDAEIEETLSPHYGKSTNGGYFIGRETLWGWNRIILDLHNELVKEHPDYYIVQIKEKFGGLRYYTGAMTDRGRDLIGQAEDKSFKTCEKCGRPGTPSEYGWVRTLCKRDRAIDKFNLLYYNVKYNKKIIKSRFLKKRKR